MEQKPAAIRVDTPARRLSIRWSDGHESVYTFTLLRDACPCAECRGGHENMGVLPDEEVYRRPEEESPRTQLRDAQPVGSYAINLAWEDGHNFGIYNWDYLRAICPCEVCRGEG